MLSKEEIEKAKEYIQQFIGIKKNYKYKPIKIKTMINTRQAIETLLQYIEQLEQEIELSNFVHECDINKIYQIEKSDTSKEQSSMNYYNKCKELEQENKKQNKMIDEMAKYIKEPYQLYIFKGRMSKLTAIKQYFEKKVEEK